MKVAVFGVVGLLAMAAGLHDLLVGSVGTQRLIGTEFAFLGLILVASSLLILPRFGGTWFKASRIKDYWVRRASVFSAFSGTLLALNLVASSFGFRGWAFLVLFAGVGAVTIVAACLRVGPHEETPRPHTPHHRQLGMYDFVQTFASLGLTATFVLSVAQSWYTTSVSQNRMDPALTLTTRLEDAEPPGASRALHPYTAFTTISNQSATRVQILTSMYEVLGFKASRANPADSAFYCASLGSSYDDPEAAVQDINRYVAYGDPVVLQTGTLIDDNSVFHAKETYSYQTTIEIPEEVVRQYSVLQIVARVSEAKGNALTIADTPSYGPEWRPDDTKDAPLPAPAACPQVTPTAQAGPDASPDQSQPTRLTVEEVVTEWPVNMSSVIWRLTRGDVAVTTVRVLHVVSESSEVPTIYACMDKANRLTPSNFDRGIVYCDGSRRQATLADYFGLWFQSTVSELPVREAGP